MHGSIPAGAILAVIFMLWDLFDLSERIREYRKKSTARRASSKKKRRAVVGMSRFKLFMSTASVANAAVHVAEAP